MLLEEYKSKISELRAQVAEIWRHLDSDTIYEKIKEKEDFSASEGFWNDTAKAEKVMSELKVLRSRVEPWRELQTDIEDLQALYDLAEEAEDEQMTDEIDSVYQKLSERFEKLNVLHLLSGEVDANDAFLTIHAGAGGTEACDWAQMLTRMYLRWAERNDYKTETLDMLEADGGIKSITLKVSGEYAFGFLKGENGIHRLVRISPFDSNARRHTSFTSVYVFPVLDDTIEVEIRPEDLRVDTYRAGGAGGQHVNKTDSAVRLTHLPTGIVVACQNERSQISNRATAMAILKARLYEYYREEKEKDNQKFAAEKKDISWGNQIRSYVFQPYTMVKDHRTKYETGNIQAVMDGDIDGFMEEYLQKNVLEASADEDDFI
ncbi:peptide chain release factor 2 [Treponema phagedenis]|uniref:Peptide chain release factor 2 n=2 Tax=Treponema phagedenis TaxID=162 RepID=A0AAE6ITZ0_TREPH|nr:peptide chain release factor 2 [Treponema phagedenis]NVP22993.1 peptide chain release factor 2 [Treponema phagedenis]QEJ95115.1 peptide chain release factor 2 [Treponema phagedenis]QEJ98211.1 peptide chain release factor 2 [Treponema phagedenis]QEK01040.1 peptide chain release factor 2 [Treponema phagedenis]QEK03721.1 peptide chain release factor 2 [Treponema phagedenis]